MTPQEACSLKDFSCKLDQDGRVRLKSPHNYYYQVQRVMGITGSQWCDFVVWTPKGISIERISFDSTFWNNMIPKLENYYDSALLPELVAPEHPNGRPIREPLPPNPQTFSC